MDTPNPHTQPLGWQLWGGFFPPRSLVLEWESDIDGDGGGCLVQWRVRDQLVVYMALAAGRSEIRIGVPLPAFYLLDKCFGS